MYEPVGVILIFVAVIAMTAIVFGIWFMVMLLKLAGRGIGALFGLGVESRQISGPMLRCPRQRCHAVNPSPARFCRRCGQELLRRYTGVM
jgi:hypothetical protein